MLEAVGLFLLVDLPLEFPVNGSGLSFPLGLVWKSIRDFALYPSGENRLMFIMELIKSSRRLKSRRQLSLGGD